MTPPSVQSIVIAIRDQSGSMSALNPTIHAACEKMQESFSLPGSGIYLHWISFAGPGCVADSEDINQLKHIEGGTDIGQAFKLALEKAPKLAENYNCTNFTFVFISDGEDSCPESGLYKIQRLPYMPWPSRLLCVGCMGFPTSLVTGTGLLFDKFGKANSLCTPPILPLNDASETPDVFTELEKHIRSPNDAPPPTEADLSYSLSVEKLLEAANMAYNACMVSCLFKKSKPEREGFAECKTVLSKIHFILIMKVREMKFGGGCERCLLPSQSLFQTKPLSPYKYLTSAVQIVERVLSKVKECLDNAERDILVSKMDNQTQCDIAGLAGRYGALATKALRYHCADTRIILRSLVEFLKEYPSVPDALPADAALTDSINLFSLSEILLDAKSVLDRIQSDSFGLTDIVQHIPLLGRTLTIDFTCKGTIMNPWLVWVRGMPSMVPIMTLPDFVNTPHDVLNMRAIHASHSIDVLSPRQGGREQPPQPPQPIYSYGHFRRTRERAIPEDTINHLMLLPSELPSANYAYLKYAACFLLYRDGAIFHKDALWGTMAATVTYLLTQDTASEWVRAELDRIRSGFRAAYFDERQSDGFSAYCDRMGSDADHRLCLITQSAQFPRNCPHLTKPLFAMWLMASEGRTWTAEQLRLRYRAFLVEMFHRAKQGLAWKDASTASPSDFALPCIADPLSWGSTARRAQRKIKPAVQKIVLAVRAEEAVGPAELDMGLLGRVQHHQFTLASVGSAFEGLARLCGAAGFSARLTQHELAATLVVTGVRDNAKRNAVKAYADSMDPKEFQGRGQGASLRTFRALLAEVMLGKAYNAYADALGKAHAAFITPILPGLARAVGKRTGVDIARALCLDEKGLSKNACLCPGCRYYLVPLGYAYCTNEMSPQLRDHLAPLNIVPGLHRAILSDVWLPFETSDEFAERVSKTVMRSNKEFIATRGKDWLKSYICDTITAPPPSEDALVAEVERKREQLLAAIGSVTGKATPRRRGGQR